MKPIGILFLAAPCFLTPTPPPRSRVRIIQSPGACFHWAHFLTLLLILPFPPLFQLSSLPLSSPPLPPSPRPELLLAWALRLSIAIFPSDLSFSSSSESLSAPPHPSPPDPSYKFIVIMIPRIHPPPSSSPCLATRAQGASRLEAAPGTLVREVREVPSAPRAPVTPTTRRTPAAPAAPGAPGAPRSPLTPGMTGAPCAQMRKARNAPNRHETNAPQTTGKVMTKTPPRPRRPPRPIHQGLAKLLHLTASALHFQRQQQSTNTQSLRRAASGTCQLTTHTMHAVIQAACAPQTTRKSCSEDR